MEWGRLRCYTGVRINACEGGAGERPAPQGPVTRAPAGRAGAGRSPAAPPQMGALQEVEEEKKR